MARPAVRRLIPESPDQFRRNSTGFTHGPLMKNQSAAR